MFNFAAFGPVRIDRVGPSLEDDEGESHGDTRRYDSCDYDMHAWIMKP